MARGWSVVPVRRGEKMPAIPWARHQSAPAHEAIIRAWFDTDPTMGLGLVQGRHVGTIILDFDGELGLATLAQLEAKGLPNGIRQFTPRGGVHVMLAHPGVHVPTRKNVLPGMDIRGDGGFVVAHPSLGSNGRPYAWDADAHPDEAPLEDVPAWLLGTITGPVHTETGQAEIIRAPSPAGPLGLPVERVTDGREQYMRDTILAVCRDLRDSLGRMPTPAELIEAAWPQYAARVDFTRPGRGRDEFEAKARYTLARIAQGLVKGFEAAPIPETAADGTAYDPETGEEVPPKPPLPLIYAIDAKPALDASDFVEGLLTEEAMSVIYGPSNCGKTFFASDLALHVATGRPWRGKETEAGGVIYCALEGSHGISNRVAAWLREKGLEGVEIPFAIVPVSINLLNPDADRAKLVATIAIAAVNMGVPVKLIIIDTLSRAMAGGNENAPDDMGALVASADFIRQACKAHICFIHHSGKDQAQGARGHSLLRAATDTEIEISRADNSSPSFAKVTKQREMEIEGNFGFTLRQVELGQNRRGKAVTSCVVEPVEGEAPSRAKRPTKLPDGAAICLRALENALCEGGRTRAPAQGVPRGVPTVTEGEWRSAFYSEMPDETQNARRMAFTRGVTKLKVERLAGLSSGLAWLVKHEGTAE